MLSKYLILLLTGCCVLQACASPALPGKALPFYPASHAYIQYTGRGDFSQPHAPRFWAAGAYVTAYVRGDSCAFVLEDEHLYNKYYNYLEIAVDDNAPYRLQVRSNIDTIRIPLPSSHANARHRVVLCKNTEAGIGYITIKGLYAQELCKPLPLPTRRIECIGNSITCGMGSDVSVVPCGKGEWYDQHNAYYSYGAITARTLQVQYHLTSVSGIGLIHSCCDLKIVMPQVFDKVSLSANAIAWDFSRYTPDVVTVCLGQNDGIQDSATFCKRYLAFIDTLRLYYPQAHIICLTSPMADEALRADMQKNLTAIVQACATRGNQKVYRYFFSKRYHKGCGEHPDVQEHREMAAELIAFVRTVTGW